MGKIKVKVKKQPKDKAVTNTKAAKKPKAVTKPKDKEDTKPKEANKPKAKEVTIESTEEKPVYEKTEEEKLENYVPYETDFGCYKCSRYFETEDEMEWHMKRKNPCILDPEIAATRAQRARAAQRYIPPSSDDEIESIHLETPPPNMSSFSINTEGLDKIMNNMGNMGNILNPAPDSAENPFNNSFFTGNQAPLHIPKPTPYGPNERPDPDDENDIDILDMGPHAPHGRYRYRCMKCLATYRSRDNMYKHAARCKATERVIVPLKRKEVVTPNDVVPPRERWNNATYALHYRRPPQPIIRIESVRQKTTVGWDTDNQIDIDINLNRYKNSVNLKDDLTRELNETVLDKSLVTTLVDVLMKYGLKYYSSLDDGPDFLWPNSDEEDAVQFE